MFTKMIYKMMVGNAYMNDVHKVCEARLLNVFATIAFVAVLSVGLYLLIRWAVKFNAKHN